MDWRRSGARTLFLASLLFLLSFSSFFGPVEISQAEERSSQEIWFTGGQLEWQTTIFEAEGHALSTPAIGDLNNDGDLEVVIFSSNGYLCGLNPDGEYFWPEPYRVDEMEVLGENNWTRYSYNDPPGFFSSPVVADINLGDTPEVLIGAGDGLYCLGADGDLQWKYHVPNGSVFCAPTLADLEGTNDPLNPEKVDLEVLFLHDNENHTTNLTILDVDGDLILDQEISDKFPATSASVVVEDLDGSFWNNATRRIPGKGEETAMELLISSFDHGVSTFIVNNASIGPSSGYYLAGRSNQGYYNTATPVAANMNLYPELEILYTTSYFNNYKWPLWSGDMGITKANLVEIGGLNNGGYGSAILGSPVVGDLQGTCYDQWTGQDYEIVYATADGKLCVKDTDFSIAYSNPYMVFDTGGPIASSPALCDVYKDRELEIVVASDSGKIFMLDGDPSDGVDEGIPYPGDGYSQDVIWCYDVGVEIGISSPVIADIDLDGMLEVVVGTTDGKLICISGGGITSKGSMDWPTFHGNNQRTGMYYDHPFYGVEMYPKRDGIGGQEKILKDVIPGNFQTFNITVELNGYGITDIDREKVFVRIDWSTVPAGWSAWLDTPEQRGNDNPDYVMLATGETADCMLKVWAPWEGDIGEAARIAVDAFSESDPYNHDRIEFFVKLDIFHDFELFFLKAIDQDPLSDLVNKNWDNINPGAEGWYTISVNNKGNLNDTIDLILSTPPREVGWDWYFVETGSLNATASLTAPSLADVFGGISGRTFTVSVTAPEDAMANLRIPILLKGRSRNFSHYPDSGRSDELYLVVGTRSNLSLSLTERYIFAQPNGTYHMNLILENTGNKDVISVLLSIQGKISGWDVKFPEEPIYVYQGQSKIVPIRIRVPVGSFFDKRAGTLVNLTFVGVIGGSPYHSSSATITYEILQNRHIYHEIQLPDDLEFLPGENFTGTLKVHSYSNFDDEISIHTNDLDPSVGIGFFNDLWDPISGFPLNMDESYLVNFRVDIPDHALAGEYPVDIILDPKINDPIKITFMVNVTFIGGLRMELRDGRIFARDHIPVNEIRTYGVKVTNNGNGKDLVTLSMGKIFYENPLVRVPLQPGWEASYYGATISDPSFEQEILISRSEFADLEWFDEDTYYKFFTEEDLPTNDHELIFWMEPGETLFIDLVLMADSKDGRTLVADSYLQIIARSMDITVLEKISLDLEVEYPDLVFGEVFQFFNDKGIPVEKPTSQGDYSIFFTVENRGNSSSAPTHLITTIDGEKIVRSDIGPMFPGSTREVRVLFTLTEGSHSVLIEIDPHNDVHELNDQVVYDGQFDNNKRTILVEVDGGEDQIPIASIATGLAVSIVLMGILLFVLLVILRRPSTSSGEE